MEPEFVTDRHQHNLEIPHNYAIDFQREQQHRAS